LRFSDYLSGYGAHAPRLWPPASLYLLHPWSRNPTYSLAIRRLRQALIGDGIYRMLPNYVLWILNMIADLHTHTTASDGTLSPGELLRRSREAGVALLSITDHDTLAAYRDHDPVDSDTSHLVAGIEFSTTWRTIGVHILGLNIDIASDAILTATAHQGQARLRRAEQIAERLERCGVRDSLAGAMAIAGDSAVGRPHFARHLVATEVVKDTAQAFKKYLGAGKAGDVKQHWAPLAQIIEWVRDSGGTAVLAHPGKYGLTLTRRLALVKEFRHLGGQGIEVISGLQDPTLTQSLAEAATTHDLLAACGSDFHRPGQPWAALGMTLTLPQQCRPVWDAW